MLAVFGRRITCFNDLAFGNKISAIKGALPRDFSINSRQEVVSLVQTHNQGV